MDIQKRSKRTKQEDLIKVVAPRQLKQELVTAAATRNISMSALVRLALTEYIKNKK